MVMMYLFRILWQNLEFEELKRVKNNDKDIFIRLFIAKYKYKFIGKIFLCYDYLFFALNIDA